MKSSLSFPWFLPLLHIKEIRENAMKKATVPTLVDSHISRWRPDNRQHHTWWWILLISTRLKAKWLAREKILNKTVDTFLALATRLDIETVQSRSHWNMKGATMSLSLILFTWRLQSKNRSKQRRKPNVKKNKKECANILHQTSMPPDKTIGKEDGNRGAIKEKSPLADDFTMGTKKEMGRDSPRATWIFARKMKAKRILVWPIGRLQPIEVVGKILFYLSGDWKKNGWLS